MSKTIGLFTGVYFNNIGNAFIDLGAEATLIAALAGNETDFNIVKISQCPFFASSMGPGFKLKENKLIHWLWVKIMAKYAHKLQDRAYVAVTSKKVFNLVDFTKLDYLVIPGCDLTVPFIKIFGDVVKRAAARGTKIIFLGASGNFYTDYEVTAVTKYLKDLCPYAIMTRDSEAYKYYKNLSKNTFNGIDNAFFVNRMSLSVPKVRTIQDPYVVLNFDESKHGRIKDALIKKLLAEGKNIVYTNHKPYPYSNIKKCADKGVMCSDHPLDYLFLYRNAEAVYSDRVHACIPALAFGNICQLFSDSPRIALFENVGLKNIKKELTQAKDLFLLQDRQIEYLRSILK